MDFVGNIDSGVYIVRGVHVSELFKFFFPWRWGFPIGMGRSPPTVLKINLNRCNNRTQCSFLSPDPTMPHFPHPLSGPLLCNARHYHPSTPASLDRRRPNAHPKAGSISPLRHSPLQPRYHVPRYKKARDCCYRRPKACDSRKWSCGGSANLLLSRMRRMLT